MQRAIRRHHQTLFLLPPGWHQYKFPYLVRNGQLKSVPGGFIKEYTECFIQFKPFDSTQYIVLHHSQGNTCYLCREVNGLTFSKSEQRLLITAGHLCGSSHGIGPVSLEETEFQVCSKQSVPLTLSPSLAEEQADCGSGELYVNHTVDAFERSVMPTELSVVELPDISLAVRSPYSVW